MKKVLPLYTTILICILSGCATVFTGSKQTVIITSVPSEADVQVDGIDRGITPLSLSLKKGFDGQTVTLKKEGYEPRIFVPEVIFNPISIINLGNIIGWAIDAASGAIMQYDPKNYEIKLVPLKEQTIKQP